MMNKKEEKKIKELYKNINTVVYVKIILIEQCATHYELAHELLY